jgi:hypothetical protein
MIQTGISASEWIPEQRLVITHITGDVDIAGVEEWDNGLQQTLSKIEDNGRFKILVNLNGFTALDLAAHKRFRTVVPQTLARYGWKTGYVHLFEEEAADMQLTNTRGISCFAAVHVHQDETKIEKYQAMFGTDTECFLTDPEQAERWIKGVEL